MRGVYEVTHDDRRKFFHSLLELCKDNYDEVDLINTQLSLSNCLDLLDELGYEPELRDTVGWEGETWWTAYHPEAPAISFSASAYYGELDMYWKSRDDEDNSVNTEALKELMRKHWGKYFPVI